MEWFYFLISTLIWIFFFYLVRENSQSAPRITLFAFITIIFGIMLLSGVNFPSGSTVTTAGSVSTQIITYTTYNASLSQGTNNFALLWGVAWGVIVMGIILLFYAIVMGYNQLFKTAAGQKSEF